MKFAQVVGVFPDPRFDDAAPAERQATLYGFSDKGPPEAVLALWRVPMERAARREAELRVVAERHATAQCVYFTRFQEKRMDKVVEELQEAANLSTCGFMAKAFQVLRSTRPSACGNKARSLPCVSGNETPFYDLKFAFSRGQRPAGRRLTPEASRSPRCSLHPPWRHGS